MTTEVQSQDVGSFIKRRVIPPGMSVTEAAKRLGVGRPALSKLLNGGASLSAQMALRLEKTFGAESRDLLERQAKSDRDRRSNADLAVLRYVPPFLTIKAPQIEAWAKTIDARHLLPVLLRKLIHSTGDELQRVDFPGYDNAQRRGWDGWVEANGATPWIPGGASGWEFGVNQDPRSKAQRDYSQRLSISAAERAHCTFVFVTPRNWPGKDEWAKSKTQSRDWKAVRAFDASDLEQWLEQSIAGQTWLAGQLPTPIPTRGCDTLDRFWDRWCAASDPRMTEKIFAPAISVHLPAVEQWLANPNNHPLSVAADSSEEAVAFLAALLRHGDTPVHQGDRAILFESAATLRAVAPSTSPFIPIVWDEECEQELASLYRRFPCIVVRPRNAVEQPDIELEILGHQPFQMALADMGIKPEDFDRLARESARSPTILRRRLSPIDAIRSPHWANGKTDARSLIPIALVGAWDTASSADCEVLSTLAGCAYEEVEQSVTTLRMLDDPPVWSVGQYCGVASKIDALFAIGRHLTREDIDRFMNVAENVLAESDPAWELPEDQRWVAGSYGKARSHSAILRTGVSETLVLLAVHLQTHLGIDLEVRVAHVISAVLTPLTLDKVLSHDDLLPLYAEAAPELVLELLEKDLQQPEPVVQGLLKPAERGLLVAPRRFGLLRALQCLAWSMQYLPRVSRVLAQLARTAIDDNWRPKPASTLATIYHSWVPQTAARLDPRILGLKMLARDFPEIGWQVCIQQIQPSESSDYNYRPRWRHWASGFGRGVANAEESAFMRSVLDLALGWPEHDQQTLGDLAEHLDGLSDQDQDRLWELVDRFARTEADDRAKAKLHERISLELFGRKSRGNLTVASRGAARQALSSLGSHDPVIRHGWLFAKPWVEGFDDVTEDETDVDCDPSKHTQRLQQLRSEAMAEIWAGPGREGVTRLLADIVDGAETVGEYVARCATNRSDRIEILRASLSNGAIEPEKLDRFMRGFIAAVSEPERSDVLVVAAEDAGSAKAARLFRCAPFGGETWRLLDQQADGVRNAYWRDVPLPMWNRPSATELAESVDRLLEAKRPHAAFHAARRDWNHVETSRLKRMLTELTAADANPADSHRIDRHDLSDALDALDGRTGVTREEMAQLEYLFIEALDTRDDGSGHGIPNLERAVADSPEIFVQAVALAYKRSDDGQDPPGWRVDDPDQHDALARKAYEFLQRLKLIPETDTRSLQRWCTTVRRLCAEYGRAEVGDIHVGQLLSHAPADEDGQWPCRAVCEVLENFTSRHIEQGFHVGVSNARGAHGRSLEEGGEPERERAAEYHALAQRLAFDYPYVSSVLERIAEAYEREGVWHDSYAGARNRLYD